MDNEYNYFGNIIEIKNQITILKNRIKELENQMNIEFERTRDNCPESIWSLRKQTGNKNKSYYVLCKILYDQGIENKSNRICCDTILCPKLKNILTGEK